MKYSIIPVLLCLAVSVSAQSTKPKGPEAKNHKVYEHPEWYSGKMASQEIPTSKGPKRKNFKFSNFLNDNSPMIAARPRNEKGPKAKNRKPY